MPAKKITCLVAQLEGSGRWDDSSRLLLDLCRVVVAQAQGSLQVAFITCGSRSALQTLQDGLTLRVLPVAMPPVEPLDALSWDVPAALADADLVHIHHIRTRLGEVGMLAAKLQRKPICVSDTGTASSTLGTEAGILALADVVIPFSDLREESLAASSLKLLEIYSDLVPSLRNWGGMRILVLSNLYPPDVIGGYELGCSQVVDALRARGHEALVLTSIPRVPVAHAAHVRRALQLTDIYTKYVMEHSTLVHQRVCEGEAHFVNARNVYTLTRALDEFVPDVAYIWHLVGLGGLGLMGCLQHLQVPWVWHLMDCVPRTLCSRIGKPIPALVAEYNRLLRGRYLACSRRLLVEIAEAGICLDGQVELLPNWIRGDRPPQRQAYFKGGHLRIVTAGQVGKHKGMDILIEASALLRAAGHESFSVDIYGKVADPTFPALIQKLGLENHVLLRGARSQAELIELYRAGRYDVFAFPTWAREPFAFGPLEAAAYGCLPVMSQICGNAEWFVHGVHCLKAERTPTAFASVFADILSGKIDVEALARRGSAAVWRDFHLDTVLLRIEGVLAAAALQSRIRHDAADEAYRLALLAEKLTQVLVQEPFCV